MGALAPTIRSIGSIKIRRAEALGALTPKIRTLLGSTPIVYSPKIKYAKAKWTQLNTRSIMPRTKAALRFVLHVQQDIFLI